MFYTNFQAHSKIYGIFVELLLTFVLIRLIILY